VLAAVMLCAVSVLSTAVWMKAQQRKAAVTTDDFVEIERLLWNNHMGYDFAAKDNGDLWTSTFVSDADLFNGTTSFHGEKEIRQFALSPTNLDPKRRFRHWTSTFQVTPNEEGALLTAFFFAVMNNGPNGAMLLGPTGRYESQVVRTKQGWKLKRHVVHPEGDIAARPGEPSRPPARGQSN
jgi:hypothetical protein